MKRLIPFFLILFFVCVSTWANEEYNITLEKGSLDSKTIELPYGIISLRLVETERNNPRVIFSVENTTMSQAILIFKNARDENSLKKNKPKIEFEKTYPGSKGKRAVFGCKELMRPLISIIPQDKLEVFKLNEPAPSVSNIELPIYLAKYDPNKLIKKGADNINYKILSENILVFNIEIKGWNENDPDYVAIKAEVDKFLRSVDKVAFCRNKRHKPSLSRQKAPYQEKKDSLANVINTMLQSQQNWSSTDLPYVKYSELLAQLNNVNLNEHTYDCGKHEKKRKVIIKDGHTCGYCSLSAQQIYHRLDDVYQQLRAGKLTKKAAENAARALNNCYLKSPKRKKDSKYTDKISKFYSRIINY